MTQTIFLTHPTDRPNFASVRIGDLAIWFSYETPIAFDKGYEPTVVRVNDWNNTTGKHLGYIDGGNAAAKKARVDGATFERMLAEAVASLGLVGAS